MSFTYEFPRPMVTVDIAVLAPVDSGMGILLIERGQPPFEGSWALPGGFVDIDEELAAAARRELEEETGLDIPDLRQLQTFGKVGRDPRGRTISVVYGAVCAEASVPRAGDDAARAAWHDLAALPELAFDHSEVISAVVEQLAP